MAKRNRDRDRPASSTPDRTPVNQATTRPSTTTSQPGRISVAQNPNVKASGIIPITRESGPARSINPGSDSDGRREPVNTARPDPLRPDQTPDLRQPARRINSRIGIKSPTPTSPNTRPERSPQVRDKTGPMCKARPTDNKPKGAGGGGKKFVPWKGTKFGC